MDSLDISNEKSESIKLNKKITIRRPRIASIARMIINNYNRDQYLNDLSSLPFLFSSLRPSFWVLHLIISFLHKLRNVKKRKQ